MNTAARAASSLTLATAVVLATALPAGAGPAFPTAPAGEPAPLAGTESATQASVTLVTGDRVSATTDGAGRTTVALLPREDGTVPQYLTQHRNGDQYVVPTSALPALAAGTLDEELFNVSGLLRFGYDDAHTDTVPLIAVYDGASVSARSAPGAPPGAERVAVLDSIGGVALRADKARAGEFWQSVSGALGGTRSRTGGGVLQKVWLDRKVHVSLDRSTAQVRATEAWAAGYDGTGTTIAVLDTGIDAEHPDLAGKVDKAEDFTGIGSTFDVHGHGTHTASIAAGTGAASDGRRKGVAPGARLIIGRVLDDWGFGTTSGIIAGMQWAVAEQADVVSMSLGGESPDCDDPIALSAQELSASTQSLFVVAAGNAGEIPGTWVDSPGCAPGVLTVGAVDRDDTTAPFSSRGFVTGTHVLKPEIAAPGVGISAALRGGRGDDAYTTASGTSMATPHVAGAAAILRQRHPDWTAQQVRAALVSAANPEVPGQVREVGAGRLDVAAALEDTVFGPASVQAGTFAWPPDTADRSTTDVTYTNEGDAPVTLDLALEAVTANDGQAAPAGIATLGATSVTVPAGGTAGVPLKVDASHPMALRQYGDIGGRIVATSKDGARVSTPFGFFVEPKSVTLTVSVLNRNGEPAGFGGSLDLASIDTGAGERRYLGSGDVQEYRVRAGTYVLSSLVATDDPGAKPGFPPYVGLTESYTYMGYPELVLEEDTTLVLDARKAHRVSVSGDRPLEAQGLGLNYGRWWDRWVISGGLVGTATVTSTYEWVSGKATRGGFEVGTFLRMTAPVLDLRVEGRNGFEIKETGFPYLRPDNDTTLLDGSGRAELVAAGTGTPEAFAKVDVRGKFALVRAEFPWESYDISANAKEAGALAVLMYVDGPGRWYPGHTNTVPQAVIDQATAQRLLARLGAGPVTIRWAGTPFSPYVYNLAFTESGPLTRPLRYRVEDWRLARSDQQWYSTTAGDTKYDEWISQIRPWDPTGGVPIGNYFKVPAPGHRTEYFSPGVWHHSTKTDLHLGITMNDMRSYRAGERRHETWYRGVLSPTASRDLYDGRASLVAERSGGRLGFLFDFGEWRDTDPNHWSAGGTEDWGTMELRRDGEPVATIEDTRGVFSVPREESAYELTLSVRTTEFAQRELQRSTETDTTFRFRSGRAPDGGEATIPLLFPTYELPVDAYNRVAARDGLHIALSATGHAGYRPARITAATLWYSYDGGQTWTKARTRWDWDRRQWVATVDHRGAAGRTVTLKADMTDANGTGVSQRIAAAYVVR